MDAGIPIFIISFNRGAFLMQVVRSYRGLVGVGDIIVHDNGSNDPATLEILRDCAAEGIKVVRAAPISMVEELNNVGETVEAYFQSRSSPGPYVVTDCDVDLGIAQADALQIYSECLERLPTIACAGPMLKIADVPRSYPLFNRMMNRHISQFWHQTPQWLETPRGRLAYIPALIDTTFAVHRAGAPFRRMKSGVRLYHPYEARHLDWYLTENDTDVYQTTSSSQVSHWNNEKQLGLYRAETLEWTRYWVVTGPTEALHGECRDPLSDNPTDGEGANQPAPDSEQPAFPL